MLSCVLPCDTVTMNQLEEQLSDLRYLSQGAAIPLDGTPDASGAGGAGTGGFPLRPSMADNSARRSYSAAHNSSQLHNHQGFSHSSLNLSQVLQHHSSARPSASTPTTSAHSVDSTPGPFSLPSSLVPASIATPVTNHSGVGTARDASPAYAQQANENKRKAEDDIDRADDANRGITTKQTRSKRNRVSTNRLYQSHCLHSTIFNPKGFWFDSLLILLPKFVDIVHFHSLQRVQAAQDQM